MINCQYIQKGGIASKRGYAEEVGNYGTCMVQYIPVHVPVRTGTKTHGTGTILSILFFFIIFLYLRSPNSYFVTFIQCLITIVLS